MPPPTSDVHNGAIKEINAAAIAAMIDARSVLLNNYYVGAELCSAMPLAMYREAFDEVSAQKNRTEHGKHECNVNVF